MRAVTASPTFSEETFGFLRDLGDQRQRGASVKTWFAANRERYETHVRAPFRALTAEVDTWLSGVDPGQSVVHSRICSRGVYTDHLWAQFGGGHGGPQLFVRVTPYHIDFGFSTYSATPWQRHLLQRAILGAPNSFWRYLGPLCRELTFEPDANDIARTAEVRSVADLVRWAGGECPRIARYLRPGDVSIRRGSVGTEVARTLLALHRLAAAIWEQEERTPDAHGVFVSYRRADSDVRMGRLHDWLTRFAHRADEREIFYDTDSIAAGDDWRMRIVDALGRSRVVLAVIGPDWSGSTSSDRRIDDPEDMVRRELEQALRLGRAVLPVLVGGARMPAASQLPDGLKLLASTQAFTLRDDRWSEDVRVLLDAIERRLGD